MKQPPNSAASAKLLFSVIKTVPVNFVVDTVLYYYCVYYEIYRNSLYR